MLSREPLGQSWLGPGGSGSACWSTFLEFQKADLNSCQSVKAETQEEQSRNSSIALGLGSVFFSRNLIAISFEFFCRNQAPIQVQFSSVQSLSHAQLFETPRTAACQASLSITNSWSLLKLMSIESVMPSNHLGLCRPILLPPSTFPSIRVFSNESALCSDSCPLSQ